MTKTIDGITIDTGSECELIVTRLFDAPPAVIYRAWSEPELFARWWVPDSIEMKLLACEMDVRTGGTYRLTFSHPAAPEPFSFFGTYTDVVPGERIVWTNDESEDGQITTVTFTTQGDATLVTLHEIYPTTAARDEAIQGAAGALPEQFAQLEKILAPLAAGD